MGTFQELKAVFFRAHARLVKAMGGKDAFDAEVVSKFPLPLGNDSILEIAVSFGWSDSFMERPQPKLRTLPPPPRPNHDVGQMMLRVSGSHAMVSKAPAVAGPPLVSRPAGPGQAFPLPAQGPPPVRPVAAPASAPVAVAVPKAGASPPPLAAEARAAPLQNLPSEPAPEQAAHPLPAHDDGGNDERPICAICQDVMINDQMALQCGHVYHGVCLRRWWQIARVPDQACPVRCPEVLVDPGMEAAQGPAEAEVPQEGECGLVDGNAPVPEEPPAADAAVAAEGDGDEFQIV